MQTAVAAFYTDFVSPIGVLGLRASDVGLTGVFMEEHRRGPTAPERALWTREDGRFAAARWQLEEYFAGARTTFDLPLDLAGTGGTLTVESQSGQGACHSLARAGSQAKSGERSSRASVQPQ